MPSATNLQEFGFQAAAEMEEEGRRESDGKQGGLWERTGELNLHALCNMA